MYHSTSVSNAYKILKSNKLELRQHKGDDPAVSFTHDKRTVYGSIVFIMDQEKLSHNYKLLPIDDIGRNTSNSSEERVLRDINNIKRYIMMIDVSDDTKLRILLKKLGTIDKDQLVNMSSSREMSAINNLHNFYLEVKGSLIPVGSRLRLLFNAIDNKLKE